MRFLKTTVTSFSLNWVITQMIVAGFIQTLSKLGWMLLTPAQNPDLANLQVEKVKFQVN